MDIYGHNSIVKTTNLMVAYELSTVLYTSLYAMLQCISLVQYNS